MKPFLFSLNLALALATSLTLAIGSVSTALAAEPSPATKEDAAAEAPSDAGKSHDKSTAPTPGEGVGEKERKEDAPAAAAVEDNKASTPLDAAQVLLNSPGEYSVQGEDRDHPTERKEIESILTMIETQWNAHDIKAVMSNYADEYINNDGLDRKAVQKLTEDFWKTYPDARAVSRTKQIRVEGVYSTVESRDVSVATCDMQGMSKGELQSVSEGQQYFKRLGNVWKIIGDRIDYEKVRVAFGLAKQLNAVFTAPEQVKSGKQFSARLEVALPPGLRAIGSITNQPLTFPQHTPLEKTRELSDQPPVLERVMPANSDNRNELLTATVILVDPGSRPRGLAILTRRLNVIPEQSEVVDAASATQEASNEKVVHGPGKDNKESSSVESAADKSSAEKGTAPSK
jgi:hypothetical protein